MMGEQDCGPVPMDIDINFTDAIQQFYDQMQIFIKSRGGPFTLLVKSSDTIINVKMKIFRKKGIPVHQQKLMFNGEQLNDNMTLANYNIREKSTVDQYKYTFDLFPHMMYD